HPSYLFKDAPRVPFRPKPVVFYESSLKGGSMRLWIAGLTLTLCLQSSAFAQLDDKVADRLWESAKVMDELVKGPDAGIPKELLKRADCVAVIPAVKKAALGFGGQYGRGAVSCRKDEGKGAFGAPSMLKLEGGS